MGREANFQTPSVGAHVLVLTYPGEGHINPMVQFSKRLASKGLKVTVITTSRASVQFSSHTTKFSNLEFITIYDGLIEGEKIVYNDAYFQRFKASICQSLFELLDHYNRNQTKLHPMPKMVIYDSIMHWVLDVVRMYGLKGGPFFTHSCAVNSIFYHVHEGTLKSPISGSHVSLPSINALLRVDDLPSMLLVSSSMHPALINIALDQFSNLKEADCVFVNSVDKLEIEAANWMTSQCNLKTIGPTIPSKYLDKRLPNDSEYGLSLYKPETNACIQWLDAKKSSSVVYISMGSVASLGEEQMKELAMGLEKCNKYLLWVVRASEENKLPLHLKEKTSEQHLIVHWCPQIEVLAHRAIGCFMTHCGWNSTSEAISLGVPMVAFPQCLDQPTNAKCITDLWRVGTRVKVNKRGIVPRNEIASCIGEVMDGGRAKEFKSNGIKWKQVAKEAMEEGGSSDKNIKEFVDNILSGP